MFIQGGVLALCLLSQAGLGARLEVGQIVYFDWTISVCPPNFEPLDSVNEGALFLGDAGNGNSGYSNGKPPLSSGYEPMHYHTGGSSLTSTTSDTEYGSLPGLLNDGLLPGSGAGTASGLTDSSGSGLPYLQLLTCRVTNVANMEVPLGAITMLDMKTSTSTALDTCPTNHTEFTPANGRFLVATSTAISPSPHATANPTTAYTSSTTDVDGDHTHTFTSTVTMPENTRVGTLSCCGRNYVGEGPHTVTGTLSSSNPNIPYRVAKTCKATTDMGGSSQEVPEGALMFFSAAACPNGWSTATGDVFGRLVVSSASGYATFGSSTLLTPSSTGGVGHAHTELTGAKIVFTNHGKSSLSTGNMCVGYNSAGYDIASAASGTSSGIPIPTLHMLLCRKGEPVNPPPTKAPVSYSLPTDPVESTTNTNACLVQLGLMKQNCPTDGGFSFETLTQINQGCCFPVASLNEMGCFCNPVFPAIMGSTNWNSIKTQLMPVCATFAVFQPNWWVRNFIDNVNCDPFTATTYNGGTCGMNDMQLEAARYTNMVGFMLAIQNALLTTECFDVHSFQSGLAPYLAETPTVTVGYGIGIYPDLASSVEYLAIVHPVLNRYWAQFTFNPDIATDANAQLRFFADRLVLGASIGFNLVNTDPDAPPATYCASLPQEYYLEQVASWDGCNTLIDYFEVPGTSALTGRATSLGAVGEISYWTMVETKDWGIEAICHAHELYCTGSYRQFDNYDQCLTFMQGLPAVDPECGSGAVLSGNSTICRFKHHFMVPLAPQDHCFHIGYGDRPDTHNHFKCNAALECGAGHPSTSDPDYIDLVTEPPYMSCLQANAAGYSGNFTAPVVCTSSATSEEAPTGAAPSSSIAGTMVGVVLAVAFVLAGVVVHRRRRRSLVENEAAANEVEMVAYEDVETYGVPMLETFPVTGASHRVYGEQDHLETSSAESTPKHAENSGNRSAAFFSDDDSAPL